MSVVPPKNGGSGGPFPAGDGPRDHALARVEARSSAGGSTVSTATSPAVVDDSDGPSVAAVDPTTPAGGLIAETSSAPTPRPRARRKSRQVGSATLAVDVPGHEAAGKPSRRRRAPRETREPLPLPSQRAARQGEPKIEVRRMHRRDLNRAWEFLKLSFRDVNLATVEYQRPRSKSRFAETYEDEGVDQLLFEVDGEIVAYAECAHEIVGSDTWLNPRYFEKRDMRPLFVEEIAVHPDWHGNGVGGFVLEQLHHLAKVRGLSHLVLEVAENNENALGWYRKRGFRKLDAAIFLAHSVEAEPELLPPRPIEARPVVEAIDAEPGAELEAPKKRARSRKPRAPKAPTK